MSVPLYISRPTGPRIGLGLALILSASSAVVPGRGLAQECYERRQELVITPPALGYERQVVVTNLGIAQSDVNIEITLDTRELIAVGQMQSGCQDLRIRDEAGFDLPYWIETGTCNTSATAIILRLPELPSGETWIYMYYGNPGLESMSDLDAVFDGFPVAAAWSMEEDSWGPVLDSSGHENVGVADGGASTVPNGKVGGAGSFDGNDDAVLVDTVSLEMSAGYWPLDGTFEDASVHSATGTPVGGIPFESGKKGQAARFNGNEYLRIDGLAGVLATGDAMTLTAWLKTTSTPAQVHGHVLFSANTASGNDDVFRIGTGQDGGIFFDTVGNDAEYGTGFNNGQWHFLAVAITGAGAVTIKVDDVEIPGAPDSQVQWSDAVLFSIGQDWESGDTASGFWNGLLDEVQVYDWALTDPQMYLAYRSTTGRRPLQIPANSDFTIETWIKPTAATAGTIFAAINRSEASPFTLRLTADRRIAFEIGYYSRSCREIKSNMPGAADGVYTIDPDGPLGATGLLQVYCDMTTDGGGWTRVVNALPVNLNEVRVAMPFVRLGKGDATSDDENAWLGLDHWMNIGTEGTMMMRCWGGNAGTRQFVAPFALSQGGTPPDYKLTWNVGCFGAYNSNVQPVSSSDYDRDTWSSDCVDYAGNAWSWESHGWGWQRNCHCGGFWDGGNAPDGPGAPLCFGVDGACWGDRHCYADKVQVLIR